MGKFEIKKSKDDRYYFLFKMENGWIVCVSEMFNTKSALNLCLHKLRNGAGEAEIIDNT